jgi:hypothetical protein
LNYKKCAAGGMTVGENRSESKAFVSMDQIKIKLRLAGNKQMPKS